MKPRNNYCNHGFRLSRDTRMNTDNLFKIIRSHYPRFNCLQYYLVVLCVHLLFKTDPVLSVFIRVHLWLLLFSISRVT